MTLVNRRQFLTGASAGLFFGPAFAATGLVPGPLRLRVGIVSDIHFYRNAEHTGLRKWWNEDLFIQALRYFDGRQVDAVMIPGDITVDGSELEHSAVAAAWQRVFPNNLDSRGQRVEWLLIRGNHDVRTGAYKQCWEKLFGEKAQEMFQHRVIKGYHFLGAHWAGGKGTPGAKAFIDSIAGNLDPKKPFFYFQHPHPKSTTVGEWVWGHDSGEVTAALSAYPNAFAISGHSHTPLTEERSLWQGAFTSLNAGSLRYPDGFMEEFDEAFENSRIKEGSKHPELDQAKMMGGGRAYNCHHGLVMNVYDEAIVLERREFFEDGKDCAVGPDWVVPFPVDPKSAPFAFARRAEVLPAPQFAEGAKIVGVRTEAKDRSGRKRPALKFDIPSAHAVRGSAVHYYAVELESCVENKTVLKRMLANDVFLSQESKIFDIPLKKCTLALDVLPPGKFRAKVTPVGFYGRKGRPLPIIIDDGFAAIDADVRNGWARMMREYYWEPTSLIYSCHPKDVQKADFFTNGFKIWEKHGDYGYGLEDCAIMGGVALSALCDQYLVTGDASLRDDARKLAQGLVNLATVHGVKGFVARGICVEDGKSVCALSSIDQHTHFLHGLWRYWKSPLLDPSLKPEIVRVVSEVADRMTAQVTEENDWSFQPAVGKGTTRGICKMRFNQPHEGARLAMFYAVAWDVSRKEEYRLCWRQHVDEGIASSLRMATQRGTPFVMDYALLQMQTSLEVLYALAPSEGERKSIRAAMQRPAEIAAARARQVGVGNGKYLCSCGELSLAQTLVPGFSYSEEQRQILRDSISAESFSAQATSMRIVHLAAAWWRWRRLGTGGICCEARQV